MSVRKSRISPFDMNSHFQTVTSPSGLGHGVHASSEKESNLMYSQLKHLYEARLETLAQGIRDAFRLVQSDELIDTMRQDMTSEEYVNQRVREIIEECINSNREALMEQLSQQIVDLHLEYGRLENENVKLLTQQEALVIEANQKIEEADEQTRLYQEEAANVKAAFRDLEGKFEESLKKKDETLIERAEKDAAEINLTKDRVKDLENKLKEAEKKHWELAKREVTLQKEQEVQRGKIKQLEADINNLNLELKASNTREEASQKKIGEYKEIQKDLERKIEEHKRENNGLKSDIELSEINKKNMEEMFNLKIQQIENAIKQEQDDHKINIEKLQNKYKEKMEKYKKKILEGKSQLALREKEANEIRKRNEESRFQTDRNAEGMQVRLQEQQEYYENQIVHIEEENHRKMNELQIKYDDQLRELQSHFQRVLEQKIEQIQEDSQEQIGQIREQEKELQELLEEKIIQIEREYIKISQHEEILLEKDKLVERFKQEIGNAEAHHRQELGLKLKGLEGRMRDEIEEKERTFKGVVRDLEGKISNLEAEKRKLTEDLGEKIEETKILSRHIEELEAQKNRLFSTIEEWGVKSKKLKEALEEEQRKRIGLESNVREQHENFGEIRMLLDDTKKEIKDRDNHINELEQQVELLESSLSDEARRYRELEIEYEESRKEGLKREQGQERVIAEIRKERETLEEDKRKLIEKIRDIERSSHDTFENEVQTHEDTKARLKQAETRAKIMISDLKAMEDEIKKLNGYIEELEKENLKTRSTIEDFENAFKETEREKIELEQGLENSRLLHEEFKREMEAVLIDKLRALRIEFREVETDCLNAINTVKRDIQFEIETMVPRFRKILEKKDEQFKFEKEAFRERLEADFGNELQGIREEYDKVLKEYNLQLAEKERTIDLMDQKQGIMTEITETLEVDAQKERQKIIDLEEESEMDKIEITELKKEKSHLEQRIEEMRARFIDELNDMRRASEEFALGKRELEQKYESDVGELTRQNYMLKEKFNQKMAIYEVKVKDLNSKQALEISGVQKDYEDQLESITEELARVQEMENLLRKENSKLRDEIERLHQEGEDTERQRQETMTVYETKLQELERDLDETSNVTKRESQLAEGLVFEKTNEIKRYKKTIQDLEEELKLRGQRIENLLQEKGRSVQVINELQEQLGVKQAELERQKEDMAYKSTYHSKEIDQLQKLLTKSYQTANEAPERRRKKENESDFQKSVEQLRNLDKYLEHKSPQRSYFMSTSREREVDFTSSRSRTDVAELRSSRERKYPSKYEKW